MVCGCVLMLCGEVCVGMVIQKVGLFCVWRGRNSDGSSAAVRVMSGWLRTAWDWFVWLACVGLRFGVGAIGG